MITLYYSSFFCRTPRCDKTYLTIGDKIIHTRFNTLFKSYIKGCHICQFSKNDKPPVRQLQQRINLNYRQLSRINMDLKVVPKSLKGHKLFNNYADISFKTRRNRQCLKESLISKYCILDYITMDQDSVFMSSLMKYLFKKFNIKLRL